MTQYKKLLLSFVLCLGLTSVVYATTTITESYKADTTIEPGTVVSLAAADTNKVEPATRENGDRIFGVAVSTSDAVVRVQSDTYTTFVTTVGNARTFVSDSNGPIETGDKLAISAITGVAQRAEEGGSVIGTAIGTFNGADDSVDEVTLNINDTQVTARVGVIDIQVQPQPNDQNSIIQTLSRVGESVAGQPVSILRILISLLMGLITLTSVSVLLFSAIKSSIVSVGRNPLSKGSVYKVLWQIAGLVLLILGGGTVVSYLILKL